MTAGICITCPDNSIHLMITSPPYNVGKDYEDDLSLADYKELLYKVMSETYRVLVEGGRACVNIANVGRAPYIPLHLYVIEIAQELGFFMRVKSSGTKGQVQAFRAPGAVGNLRAIPPCGMCMSISLYFAKKPLNATLRSKTLSAEMTS